MSEDGVGQPNMHAIRSMLLNLPLQGKLIISNDNEATQDGSPYYVTIGSPFPMSILDGSIEGVQSIFAVGEDSTNNVFFVQQYFSKIYIKISGITSSPQASLMYARITLQGKNVKDGQSQFYDVDDPDFSLGPAGQEALEVLQDASTSGTLERVVIAGGYLLTDVYEGDEIRIKYENLSTNDTAKQQYIIEVAAYY